MALPALSSWAQEGKPLRLIQQSVAKEDPDPKAISCYGLYLPELGDTWLRFVDGRSVSSITTQFLSWCCEKLEASGKKVLLFIWDNASWHVSKEVRRCLGKHNRRVKMSSEGVRIVSCLLPKHSPWLNTIEPKWVHGKRKVVEPDGLLETYELAERGSVESSVVRITSVCLSPRRSPDRALGNLGNKGWESSLINKERWLASSDYYTYLLGN